MPQSIIVSSPSTVKIRFTQMMPKKFVINDANGNVHYFRYLSGSIPRIKFRMPIPGTYSTDTPIEITSIGPIEIPEYVINPSLPPATRNRWKTPVYKFNPELGTVARIFTDTGVIEHGPRYKLLMKPMQVFIDEHEKGHMLYDREEDCDLYAIVNFVRMGYNESTAYYALSMVIKRSAQQMDRVKSLFKTIVGGIQPDFNPGI